MTQEPVGDRHDQQILIQHPLSISIVEAGTVFDDTAGTVATTWRISMKAADALEPRGLAGRVLALASVLDPSGIPRAVLMVPAALAYFGAPEAEGVSGDAVGRVAVLVELTADAAARGRIAARPARIAVVPSTIDVQPVAATVSG